MLTIEFAPDLQIWDLSIPVLQGGGVGVFKVVLSRSWVMFFYGNSVGGSSGLVMGWIYLRGDVP